jgi:hypothetical protein
VPPVAEPSAAPRRLQSLLIQGGGAPDVHVSLVAGGGHDPTPVVAEAGGTTPERMGESVAAVEAASRSRAAPETAGLRCAAPRAELEACRPRAGLVRPPGEEGPGALQDVSFQLQIFFLAILPTCLLTLPSVLFVDTPTPACSA